MDKIVLLTGGNIGDIDKNMRLARELIISRVGREIAHSSLHRSQAWGFDSDDEFVNQVIVVESELQPLEVLDVIQQIETELGRVRDPNCKGYMSRTMDIDILYFGDRIINDVRLQVPHPLIDKREFVLIPLRELGIK